MFIPPADNRQKNSESRRAQTNIPYSSSSSSQPKPSQDELIVQEKRIYILEQPTSGHRRRQGVKSSVPSDISFRTNTEMARIRACLLILTLGGAFHVSSFAFSSVRSLSASRLTESRGRLLPVKHSAAVENAETAVELGRERLAHHFDFPLDDWQLQAGGEILLGHNVIVSAPTGSG